MKEQGPIYPEKELTNQSNQNRLKGEGGHLMPEPGNSEGNLPQQPSEGQNRLDNIGDNDINGEHREEKERAGRLEEPLEKLAEPLTEEERAEVKSLAERIYEHDRHRPDDREEAARLTAELNDTFDRLPVVEAAHVDPELLELAAHFPETIERLINRIIFKAYEDKTETNEYHAAMNLYAQSNLDTLLGFLSRKFPDKYKEYISLKTVAEKFHDMNRTLNSGNLNNFLGIAENITYQYFETIKSVTGAFEVNRIFEQKFNEHLRKNKRILTSDYSQIKTEAEQAFRMLNDAGLIRSEYTSERTGQNKSKLSEWEVQRALNVGRVLFNISFRAAEKIATGQFPRKGDQGHKQFGSFPQEQAVKLMNWVQWSGLRFDIARARGGVKFLEGVKDRYREFLVDKAKKAPSPDGNMLLEFGGLSTEEIEVGAMFGVSGLYSSWRMENMIYEKLRIGEGKTLRQWHDEQELINMSWRQTKDGSLPSIERIRHEASHLLKEHESIEHLQDQLLEVYRPVIEGLNVGIGAYLKNGNIDGLVGLKVRQALWEKAAERNLPLMIDYLSRIRMGTEADLKSSRSKNIPLDTENRIQQILDSDSINWNEVIGETEIAEGVTFRGGTRWEYLTQKILLNHEYQVKRATKPGEMEEAAQVRFSEDEQRIINQVIEKGKAISWDLANIVFPYAPFLNDLPFEEIDFSGPGEEFYRRRTGSDLGSYFKAEGEFVKIMNNPGGEGIEQMLQHFDGVIKGIESPQGTGDAQERVLPMFQEWLQLIMAQPVKRQFFVKGAMEFLRKPTSLAKTKEFAGVKGLALDEAQSVNLINDAVKVGILNPELADELREKEKLTVANIIWMLFRDYLLWLPITIAIKETVTQAGKQATD